MCDSAKGILYALYKLFHNLRWRKEEIQVRTFNAFILAQFYWIIFDTLDSVWNKSLHSANINKYFPFALGQLQFMH